MSCYVFLIRFTFRAHFSFYMSDDFNLLLLTCIARFLTWISFLCFSLIELRNIVDTEKLLGAKLGETK